MQFLVLFVFSFFSWKGGFPIFLHIPPQSNTTTTTPFLELGGFYGKFNNDDDRRVSHTKPNFLRGGSRSGSKSSGFSSSSTEEEEAIDISVKQSGFLGGVYFLTLRRDDHDHSYWTTVSKNGIGTDFAMEVAHIVALHLDADLIQELAQTRTYFHGEMYSDHDRTHGYELSTRYRLGWFHVVRFFFGCMIIISIIIIY